MGHALLSPSASSRWLHCKASALLAVIMPGGGSSAAAEYGTQLHAEAEEILGRAFKTGELQMLPEPKDPQTVAMHAYVQYVFQQHSAGCDVTLEGKEVLTLTCSGTADAIAIDEDFETVEVSDLKTGNKLVSPQSTQVGIYLAAVRRRLTEKNRKYYDYSYKGTIGQSGRTESCVWSAEKLNDIVDRVREVEDFVKDVIFGKAKLADGFCANDSTCHWCPAAGNCVARRQSLFDASEGVAKEVASNAAKGISTDWAPLTLSVENRADIIKAAPRIRKWLDEVEAVTLAEAHRGVTIPGFEIGQKRAGTRAWANEKRAAEAILANTELSKDQLFQPKFISPAQAEKLGVPEETLDALVIRKEGKAALVPAKTVDPTSLFE